MLTLFAVGVVTGTILSFEMGLLWPNFTARSAASSGSASRSRASRSSSRRSSSASTSTAGTASRRRAHLLCGIPIVIAGFTGSLMVIAVNAWMNHPDGFALRERQGRSTCTRSRRCSATRYLWHELIHMYLAGYIVDRASWSPACYASARLRGRWGRYERTALTIPLTVAALAAPVQILVGDWAARDVADHAADQAGRDRGPRPRPPGARPSTCSAGTTGTASKYGIAIPHAALAARLPRPERDGAGPRRRAGQTSARRSTSCASPSRRWSGSARCSRCSASSISRRWSPARRLPESRWFYRALVRRRAAVGGRADRRLGRRPRSAASPGSSTA